VRFEHDRFLWPTLRQSKETLNHQWSWEFSIPYGGMGCSASHFRCVATGADPNLMTMNAAVQKFCSTYYNEIKSVKKKNKKIFFERG
jgi:hypothetical protein